jgi:hypothetical protein
MLKDGVAIDHLSNFQSRVKALFQQGNHHIDRLFVLGQKAHIILKNIRDQLLDLTRVQ